MDKGALQGVLQSSTLSACKQHKKNESDRLPKWHREKRRPAKGTPRENGITLKVSNLKAPAIQRAPGTAPRGSSGATLQEKNSLIKTFE